jgi:hypothetical protein
VSDIDQISGDVLDLALRVGLLLNFGGATLKEGVRRIFNDHHASASPRLRVNNLVGE